MYDLPLFGDGNVVGNVAIRFGVVSPVDVAAIGIVIVVQLLVE